MITSDSSAPTIDAWLEFIEDRERRLHALDSFEIAQEHQVEFHAVYGICAQAIRYAGAYVALYRVGRSREAVAVARQALEHALTAQWAHFNESGPDQLIESYHHSLERAFRAVMTQLNEPQDQVDAALKPAETRGKQLIRVTDRIKAIDLNEMFITAYSLQSQIVHVTSETATAFIDLDDEKNFILLSEADDPHLRHTVRFTAMATMFASWVLESLRVDTPGLDQLRRVSEELDLPLNIRA